MLRRWITTFVTVFTVVLFAVPLNAGPIANHSISVENAEEATITVRIRNEYRWDVTVQLVTKNGRTIDLGPVAAGTGLVAQVAESILDGTELLQLRAVSVQKTRSHLGESFLTDDTVTSRLFTAKPGGVVEMRVGEELSDTRIWVHRG